MKWEGISDLDHDLSEGLILSLLQTASRTISKCPNSVGTSNSKQTLQLPEKNQLPRTGN